MWQSNDDFPFSPFTPGPLQPVPLDVTNDPAFNDIYDYISDFSSMGGNLLLPSTSSGADSSVFDDYLQSTSVNPLCDVPAPDQSPGSSQEQVVQPVGSKLGKIRIKSQPREKFRPRTEKESQGASHYIRSAKDNQPGYPSIHVEDSWKGQNSIIQVSLVDKDGEEHPYTIDNKERETSPLIFKQDEVNSLYFHVTDSDFKNKEKVFRIQYIKPKQDHQITKELINTRKLYQSMLRFTRFFQAADGTYQPDLASIEYSCLMTEDYGDLNIEDVFPLYGPMCGNQKVCIETKGFLPKDLKADLTVTLTESQTNWFHQIDNINKNRNNFNFIMPPYPYLRPTPARVTLLIQYKDKIISESTYIYTGKLDEDLTSSNTANTNIRYAKRPRQ